MFERFMNWFLGVQPTDDQKVPTTVDESNVQIIEAIQPVQAVEAVCSVVEEPVKTTKKKATKKAEDKKEPKSKVKVAVAKQTKKPGPKAK